MPKSVQTEPETESREAAREVDRRVNGDGGLAGELYEHILAQTIEMDALLGGMFGDLDCTGDPQTVIKVYRGAIDRLRHRAYDVLNEHGRCFQYFDDEFPWNQRGE